jgi:hypothetical protein
MKSVKIWSGQGAIVLLIGLMIGMSSCEIDPVFDPNNPDLNSVLEDPQRSFVQNLVDGALGGMRIRQGTYLDAVGVVGREYYRFSSSDPRFTSDLLGRGSAILDNNTFYTTGPFTARYRVVNNLEILIQLANAIPDADITAEERNGVIGFANTLIAHELLLVLNQQYSNGIRADITDENSPFLSLTESLDAIANRLDDASTDLAAAGTDLMFNLNSGWSSFSDVNGVSRFNRALAARVDAYREDWAGAIEALQSSFLNVDQIDAFDLNDANNDLGRGIYMPYSSGGGDLLNPLFFVQNSTGETRVAQPDLVAEATAGDGRSYKFSLREEAAFSDDLTSDYDVTVYAANTDAAPIIREEELILLWAEAQAQNGNPTESIRAIDAIRAAHDLPAYSGGSSTDELIDEMLYQRAYSLFGEGHRWVDMRRYDRLDQLPIDRVDDDVWLEYPRPLTEG